MNASARIPCEKVLTVCDWALARIEEIRLKKDGEFLRKETRRRNRLRGWFRMSALSDAEVHERLLGETDSYGYSKHNYPWRSLWERDFRDLRTLARDACGGVRMDERNWCDMLRWCGDNGWTGHGEPAGS